jgi:uroporphyrinogen decarboxylase
MQSLFLNALQGKNQGRPPIWMMRQAGRYMPEYKALRKHQSLLQMFHDVEKIVEVTLLPIDLLNVDAAILFSDILSLCDGLGKPWHFEEGKGPILSSPLTPGWKFHKKSPYEAYGHIDQAIRELKKTLKVPLLGFAGAPFTVASYLIEGGSSRDLKKTKTWAYTDPASFRDLLEEITEATIEYLDLQIEAGVDAVQIFDSWAGVLDTPSFHAFSLHYMEKILKRIKKVPVILFCKGSCFFAEEIAQIKPAAISLDWSGEMHKIRAKIPNIPLQGNLDPMVLCGTKERILQEADRLLTSMRHDPAYIFNLGHGILPETPFENVKFLVDHVTSQQT